MPLPSTLSGRVRATGGVFRRLLHIESRSHYVPSIPLGQRARGHRGGGGEDARGVPPSTVSTIDDHDGVAHAR